MPATPVPVKITQLVRGNYNDSKILEIEKYDGEIEVTLFDYIDVTLNAKFDVTDIE